jgi:putative DNA primase/helicase
MRDFENIPAELRAVAQWVCWKLEMVDGRLTKVPYTVAGSKADSTKPQTWGTFESCRAALRTNKFSGLGFVFAENGNLTGIDLDKHRNADTGELDPFAAEYVSRLNSYTEISQSGTGVHIIARATVPGDKGRRDAKTGVEMYSKARFFVMTGNHLDGTPHTVELRQQAVDGMFREIFPTKEKAAVQKPAPAHALALTDHDLIEKASQAKNGAQFSALWRGDFAAAGYASQSEADAALLSALYFWTGGDKDRSFSLFSQSGLNRPKWQRADYRESTWQLVAHGETYSPQSQTNNVPTRTPASVPEAAETKPVANPAATNTPAQWFAKKFPSLLDEHGTAILEETDKAGIVTAKDIGEDFFAATLGENGSPDAPTVFVPTEEKFYTYLPGEGVFIFQREPVLLARLSRLLLECARACRDGCETKTLEFRFRDAANLSGVLKKARGLLEVPHDYFASDLTKFIPCDNGMLRLDDKTLLPFSPAYKRRNKLAVRFDAAAKCPLFLDTLMRAALDDDDLDLLQRWCGLALIGENQAQKILILTGTAGGGKGTFIRVLTGVIGQINLASLRTQLLGERFELGRFLGKTLLCGADVPENFLNQRGASVLKSLTGYDPVTLEFKNSNESPAIYCKFNVIVTCNSRLTVHLEGDTDAWRRRLAIIEYRKPKPEKVIADLDKQILATEASGVLNWMLAGLDKLRTDDWQLNLTSQQQRSVDNLLLESEGHTVFVRECLARDAEGQLTVPDCFSAYVEFCNQHGWTALTKNKFGSLIGDVVVRQFGITARNDIQDASGKAQRGWKGIRRQ